MKTIILAAVFAAAGWAQCGKMVINPTTGKLDCIGTAGSGSFTALSGDATSTATGGATTVNGINNVSMSSLATGIVKNTTGTGAPSIAALADITALTGTGSTAQTNLGITPTTLSLLIGTNTEAWSSNLDAWSLLATSAKAPAASPAFTGTISDTGTSATD